MDRRELIATGLGAASLAALPRLAGARETTQSSELPPAAPAGASPDQDPAYGYGPPPADGPPPEGPPPPPQEAYPDRRGAGPAGEAPPSPRPSMSAHPSYPARTADQTYDRSEIVNSASDFMGVPAEGMARAVERIFRDNGRPTAYIAGEEASGAVGVGLRYGKGLLYMKGQEPVQVYWRGPSVGWDFGGNASRAFTLVYNLHYPDMLFRRFPGVEGSAYFVGGLGVNYQRAEDITLAPIRAGVGLRLGANVGYLAYSRKKHFIPF